MLPEHVSLSSLSFFTCLLSCVFISQAQAIPSSVVAPRDNSNPLGINIGPAPAPEDGPPDHANSLRDPSYLPAQIGGIVGAYAFSLVLVAITLLALSKKRREHLNAPDEDIEIPIDNKADFDAQDFAANFPQHFPQKSPVSVRNFSYPSPTRTEFNPPPLVIPTHHHSPASSICAPGINHFVDQGVVAADRAMAQQQLEAMYKHVMEHEDAKQRGVQLDPPSYPNPALQGSATLERNHSNTSSKKGRSKPASLNLSGAKEDRQSKTSSLLSALRSPKKKPVKGVNISSPIMTPQSATFPRQSTPQEMTSIPPRQYAPAPPPPIPTDQISYRAAQARNGAPLTPDMSPESIQSIDERIGNQLGQASHARTTSLALTELDPESATSEHSQVPLVGRLPTSPTRGAGFPSLPASPKPGATFPSLPASPKPGATFDRPNPSTAVRTGGSLPLRAYDGMGATSPTATQHTTKQTVFERKGPLSPMSARTPGTSVPYSPYQPFTPCMPITPSLVTKEDRKRMKRMVPKTPTMEMVRSADDIW